MAPPISPHCTRTKNPTQHPGLVLLEGQKKRHTKAQIAQDKQDALEAQAIKEAALQHAAMEVEQATQATKRPKPVKLWAKPVKTKASVQGATSHHTKDNEVGGVGVGAGSDKVIGNEEVVNEAVKIKKKKKRRHLIADKKGNLNPVHASFHDPYLGTHLEPESKPAAIPSSAPSIQVETVSGDSFGISSTRTSQTVATTVSLAKDPPLSLTDSSETSQALTSDDDKDEGGDEDPSEVADKDDDDKDDYFKERLSSLKGKGGMQSVVAITGEITESSEDETPEVPVLMPFNLLPFTQQANIVQFALEQAWSTHTVSSTKRPIDSVNLIGSSEDLDATDEYNSNTSFDAMLLDDADVMSPEVEPSPKPALRITSKTSVTVHRNPNPPKKAKLEPTSQIMSIPTLSEPDLMSADTMTRPKGGTQWRKTDLPPIMLVDGIWRRPFSMSLIQELIITSNQKAPLLVCNFGFMSMALVANFLATSKDDEDEDDNDTDFEKTLAASLLEEWAFLYEDPEARDPNQIYQSAFMLEMIDGCHINPISGFLDVPALNTDDLQLKGMQAVIAACAASLEHAFNFVAKPPSSAINPAAKIALAFQHFRRPTVDSPSRGGGRSIQWMSLPWCTSAVKQPKSSRMLLLRS
ncbi:uncharacterized protein EDB91DRAFT_1084050 [Suillus paluster]|uniref:uncharacterized protein n=1 Tax=Suillus paluster TaxID=48578 RepID=UPI001B8651AD|nr:uncharacterized protein EDB91DRAFT_1084050 [Suillus paluster]KAG1734388.1 hypothetical protein EDB91DRAFT_1084050 [Suillus paluster]